MMIKSARERCKIVIFALVILAAPPTATAQDRVSVVPALQRWCANTMRSDPKAIQALAILRTNLVDFCSCASSLLVSALSDSEIAAYARSHQLPARINDIWQ